MDRAASTKRDVLERMLFDESVEPTNLPLSLLEYITDDFSDDKQIGRGGFAVVYKGMLRNGTIAVKKLFNTHLHENKFKEEVECLMKAKHKNVVRFLGYCADTQGMMERYNGKLVLAEVPQRLLCFEYLPKGSLHDYITDTSNELEWTQCYQIVMGICAGLHYLHKNYIVHLDLKPANILFDDNVVPKIADFGLSRCFDEEQSHVITSKLYGTLGYIAPEVLCGRITFKSDMYSLGVIIIEILTGQKMYLEDYDVIKRWGNRLDKFHREKQLEQLRVCAEIGKECTDYDPRRRPDVGAIVRRLDEANIDMSNLSTAQGGTWPMLALRKLRTSWNRCPMQQPDPRTGRGLLERCGKLLSSSIQAFTTRGDAAGVVLDTAAFLADEDSPPPSSSSSSSSGSKRAIDFRRRFDAHEVFPEPAKRVDPASGAAHSEIALRGEIERRLRMCGITEPARDLETLKQILEALQLKGLLYRTPSPPAEARTPPPGPVSVLDKAAFLVEEDLSSSSGDPDYAYVAELVRLFGGGDPDYAYREAEQRMRQRGGEPDTWHHRRLLCGAVAEALERQWSACPWEPAAWLHGAELVSHVWAEVRRAVEPVARAAEAEAAVLNDVTCSAIRRDLAADLWASQQRPGVGVTDGVLQFKRLVFKDLAADSWVSQQRHGAGVADAVLHIERLVLKDIVAETIRELSDADRPLLRRKLVLRI